MAKLELRRYDDPILRKKAVPIGLITSEIEQLAKDMIETMLHANGVGLAGPQVGQLVRIFVIRDEVVGPDEEYSFGTPEVLINPTLSHPSEQKVGMVEGCLSLPGLYVEVIRPKKIHVQYMNLQGEWIEEDLDAFRARVIMHENDHLNGVLTIDRLDKATRKKIEPNLLAIKKKFPVLK
jgi:peptide deformylase